MPLHARGAALVGVDALEGVSDLQEEMLIGDGADELKADRQTCGGETAGNGYCGNACKIRGAIGTKQQSPRGIILFSDADGFLTYERGCDGRGGNSQGVNTSVRHD